MDVKTGYSTMVNGSKCAAETNEELRRKISAGQYRTATYKANWTPVNINTIVDRFAPGASPQIVKGKVVYISSDGKYEILADIGGGYLRILDSRTKHYADAEGNDVCNYTDAGGKQHGNSPSTQLALTHFRILKREEM